MEDQIELRVELKAIALVKRYFESRGWHVENVSRLRGSHGGYDLLATKDSEVMKVEVKGSGKPYNGIPDLFSSEIDADKRLVADCLCIAFFPPGMPEKLAFIRREDIPPEYVLPKSGYRISGSFKNARALSKFMVKIDDEEPS